MLFLASNTTHCQRKLLQLFRHQLIPRDSKWSCNTIAFPFILTWVDVSSLSTFPVSSWPGAYDC